MINGTQENVGRLLSSGYYYVYTYLLLLVVRRYISDEQKAREDAVKNKNSSLKKSLVFQDQQCVQTMLLVASLADRAEILLIRKKH